MTQKMKGFTLLEVTVVVAILGVMMAFAAPSLKRVMVTNQMRAVAGEWRSAFYLAQKEAIRLKRPVQLCASKNGESCDNANANDYSQGWIVFDVNEKKVIRDYPPIHENVVVNLGVGNGVDLIFLNNGRPPLNFVGGILTITHKTVKGLELKLSVSRAGRIQ